MKTILDILKLSTDYLNQRKIRNPRRQAEDIIGDALGIKRLQLYLDSERPLLDSELQRCRDSLVRRGRGEPSQYIHGEVQFMDCTIKVTPDVLIPRPETEILVDKIIKDLSTIDLAGKTLWDICCGSGCIGIALKKKFPELEVFLSDLSSAALAIAKENAKINEVSVSFYEGDLLKPFAGKKADFIVCNPPYIAESEWDALDTEVKHEPRMALISGKTGLEFYERFASQLINYLHPKGRTWFELGTGQGAAILNLFERVPGARCRVEKDWSGHDRFFFLEIESNFE